MNKVYLVVVGGDEYYRVETLGVFSSLQNAENFKKVEEKKARTSLLYIQEWILDKPCLDFTYIK